LAIIFFAYDHFREQNPRLKIELASRANVIDLKEKISDLDIFYKGASLRTNQQTLAVITLKISNDGAAPIPIGAYDTAAPVGVSISKRKPPPLVETELNMKISAKVNELTKNMIAGEDGVTLQLSLSIDPVITKAQVI